MSTSRKTVIASFLKQKANESSTSFSTDGFFLMSYDLKVAYHHPSLGLVVRDYNDARVSKTTQDQLKTLRAYLESEGISYKRQHQVINLHTGLSWSLPE
jgi:hypothetical protein